MILSEAQRTTLRADILANQDTATAHNDGNLKGLADLYNADATPGYRVWRTSVKESEITGNALFSWVRVDNLTDPKARIWEWMFRSGTVNPSLPNVTAGINACFTAPATDAPNRNAFFGVSNRLATRLERLFATGAGTVPTDLGVGPGVMGVEGKIVPNDFILNGI